ncbi:Uncharacterized protein TCAP_02411, partial [Tolypocladium capitatum]
MSSPTPAPAGTNVSTEVERRSNTLLRKMPQGEEDWNNELSSPDKVEDLRRRLTLSGIEQDTSLEDIFQAYVERLKYLNQIGAEADAEFLKIIAIATGEVAIKEFELRSPPYTQAHEELKRAVNNGIRACFWQNGSAAKLDDKLVVEYRRAVQRGTQLLWSLAGHLGFRAYELPWHVRHLLSIFMICRYNGAVQYIMHKVTFEAYRPREQWDSRIVFIPNLVHANLGGRL